MEIVAQTVVQMTIIKKNGYCPVFKEGQKIIIKKHCFDTSINTLQKYCYATLADIYPMYFKMRKEEIGSKESFSCRDNGIIEIEVERLADELYDYENK